MACIRWPLARDVLPGLLILLGCWSTAKAVEAQPRGLRAPDMISPTCDGHVKAPPLNGSFLEFNLSDNSKARAESGGTATGWDFLVEGRCRYPLWDRDHAMDCLKGAWLTVVGASSANIWMVQLANMLVKDALITKRDEFNIDGVWTQMLDIIIEDGKVTYRNIVVDHDRKEKHDRKWAHSYKRDHKVLAEKFAELDKAPEFSPNAIRITHFIAEFWDNVGLAVDALEAAGGGWEKAEIAMTVSLGLWYVNSLSCMPWDTWCATRPPYEDLNRTQLVSQFRHGMEAQITKLDDFCKPGGRTGNRGCSVTSIDHCFWMKGPIWHELFDVSSSVMQAQGSDYLRFVDVWTMTSVLPLDCIGEHQSPMSTLWTWQILLNGFCTKDTAAEGSIAVFKGNLCREAQVQAACKNFKDEGFKYDWECALAEPCELSAYRPDEFQVMNYSECDDYMDKTGCGWTSKWNCPGQAQGTAGSTSADGSLGYTCCCQRGLWNEARVKEATAYLDSLGGKAELEDGSLFFPSTRLAAGRHVFALAAASGAALAILLVLLALRPTRPSTARGYAAGRIDGESTPVLSRYWPNRAETTLLNLEVGEEPGDRSGPATAPQW